MDKNTVLLIHIPKTSGTSVKDIFISNKIDFRELHFNSSLECMPNKYIDHILENDSQRVVITWRNPVEHLISTFYFYQEYPQFNYPKELNEFISSKDLHNQQSSFLFKNHFLKNVNLENKLDKLYKLINRPNTFLFLQDCFDESVNKLNDFLGIEFTYLVTVKRFNFNKLPSYFVSKEIKEKIKELNKIDMDIYEKIIKKYNLTDIKNDKILNYIPWQYPLNLIAGINSINKYEGILKSINKKLGIKHNIRTYINEFLNLFANELGLILVTDNYLDKLKELMNVLNDNSEKIIIPTRF